MKSLMKAGLVLGVLSLLSGCTAPEAGPGKISGIIEGEELFCICRSQEEAEEIAESYGIELVRWSDNVAVFHTEEDPGAIIRYGQENGLVPLSLNRRVKKIV